MKSHRNIWSSSFWLIVVMSISACVVQAPTATPFPTGAPITEPPPTPVPVITAGPTAFDNAIEYWEQEPDDVDVLLG